MMKTHFSRYLAAEVRARTHISEISPSGVVLSRLVDRSLPRCRAMSELHEGIHSMVYVPTYSFMHSHAARQSESRFLLLADEGAGGFESSPRTVLGGVSPKSLFPILGFGFGIERRSARRHGGAQK
jgi:hypothetical protein